MMHDETPGDVALALLSETEDERDALRTRLAAAIRAEQARYWSHDEDVDVVLARLLRVVEGGSRD